MDRKSNSIIGNFSEFRHKKFKIISHNDQSKSITYKSIFLTQSSVLFRTLFTTEETGYHSKQFFGFNKSIAYKNKNNFHQRIFVSGEGQKKYTLRK